MSQITISAYATVEGVYDTPAAAVADVPNALGWDPGEMQASAAVIRKGPGGAVVDPVEGYESFFDTELFQIVLVLVEHKTLKPPANITAEEVVREDGTIELVVDYSDWIEVLTPATYALSFAKKEGYKDNANVR